MTPVEKFVQNGVTAPRHKAALGISFLKTNIRTEAVTNVLVEDRERPRVVQVHRRREDARVAAFLPERSAELDGQSSEQLAARSKLSCILEHALGPQFFAVFRQYFHPLSLS